MTGKEPSLETILLALLVLQCAMLYAQLPKAPKPERQQTVTAPEERERVQIMLPRSSF